MPASSTDPADVMTASVKVSPHIDNEYEGVVDTIVQLFVSGISDVMRLLGSGNGTQS